MTQTAMRIPLEHPLHNAVLFPHVMAALAHKLRNPLTAVQSAAEILQMRIETSPDTAKCLEILRGECLRLGEGICQAVEFAGDPEEPEETHDALLLIEEVLQEHEEALQRHGWQCHVQWECPSFSLRIPRRELREIFYYLLWSLSFHIGNAQTLFFRSFVDTQGKTLLRFGQSMQEAEQVWDGKGAAFFQPLQLPGDAFGMGVVRTALQTYRTAFFAEKDSCDHYTFVLQDIP